MAVGQLQMSWLTHCYRGQAPSHMGFAVFIHCVSGAGSVWEQAPPTVELCLYPNGIPQRVVANPANQSRSQWVGHHIPGHFHQVVFLA